MDVVNGCRGRFPRSVVNHGCRGPIAYQGLGMVLGDCTEPVRLGKQLCVIVQSHDLRYSAGTSRDSVSRHPSQRF